MATTETHTETEVKVASMLTEPTGVHMLDSGGIGGQHGYGRHWERNQGKTVEAFKAEPRAFADKYGYATLSLFHFLCERLTYRPDIDADFQAFAETDEYRNEGWLVIMDDFAAMRQRMNGTGYPFEQPTTENSYNQSDLLTQTIQFTIWSEGEDESNSWDSGETFVLLQIHGGCDVRGGYSTPVVFQVDGGGDYAFEFFEYERFEAFVVDREAPVSENQLTLDGKTPEWWEIDPIASTRFKYDTHGGWEVETYGGSYSSLEELFGENADKWMDSELWDEERQAHRSPDGNGWIAVDAPFVSG